MHPSLRPSLRRPHRGVLLALTVPAFLAGVAGPATAGTTSTTSTAPTTTTTTTPGTDGPMAPISGLTVTPSTGLHDLDTVRVQAHVQPGGTYQMELCSASPAIEDTSCVLVSDPITPDHSTIDAPVRLPALVSYDAPFRDCRRQPTCTLVVWGAAAPEHRVMATVSFAPVSAPATKPRPVPVKPHYTG